MYSDFDFDDYSEQYDYTRVYDKMMRSLTRENEKNGEWNPESIYLKNRLISLLHVDISTDNKKYGYTYKSKYSTIEQKQVKYRYVFNNLKFNNIHLEYTICHCCGEYLEAKSILPINIACNCEIEIYFQRRRCLERIHNKIQHELRWFEEKKNAGIIYIGLTRRNAGIVR
jgi:hypothetical protein